MQKEASRRSGRASFGTRSGGKYAWNCVQPAIAAPHVDHGPHRVAHHVVHKAVSAHAVNEQASPLDLAVFPTAFEDGSNGRPRAIFFTLGLAIAVPSGQIWLGGGETGEVVLAEELPGGRSHHLEIQRPRAGVDISRQKGRADRRMLRCFLAALRLLGP